MERIVAGASKEEIEVSRIGAEVLVHVRDAFRRIALPASIEGREIERIQLREIDQRAGIEHDARYQISIVTHY